MIKILLTVLGAFMVAFGSFTFVIEGIKYMANYDGPYLKAPGSPILLLYFGIAVGGLIIIGIIYRKQLIKFFKNM